MTAINPAKPLSTKEIAALRNDVVTPEDLRYPELCRRLFVTVARDRALLQEVASDLEHLAQQTHRDYCRGAETFRDCAFFDDCGTTATLLSRIEEAIGG